MHTTPSPIPTPLPQQDPSLTRTYWTSAAPLDPAGAAWWVTIWLDVGGVRDAVADVHPIILDPPSPLPTDAHDAAITAAGYRRASSWEFNPGPGIGFVAWIEPGA